MARGDQLARQWRILQELIASRTGRSVPELARAVDCHVRTVYRDLEALQAAGFPVTTAREGRRTVWSLLDPARRSLPVPFTLPELLALYMGRRLAAGLEGTVFYEALESLGAKIRLLLPPEMAAHLEREQEAIAVDAPAAKRHAAYRGVLEAIAAAVSARRRIDLTYRAASSGRQTRRRVDPYRLLYHGGSFYLLAYCNLRKDIRVFAVDRIRRLAVTGEGFPPPEGIRPEEVLQADFGVFHGPPLAVCVRFAPEAAPYVLERTWHPSQRLTREPDGSVLFEARVAGEEEIKRWVLKWGAQAEVLSPEGLRRAIAAEAEAIARRYGSPLRRARRPPRP
ncbi:MAG: YafY family protein [Desulfobacterales bacterium]